MKKYTLKIISILALIILVAKISNWFFNFSDGTNNLINYLMFSVIGMSYLIYGFSLKNKLNKIILLVSGLYLIIWNFLPERSYLTIIGIFAIISPMLIGRFSKETNNPIEN